MGQIAQGAKEAIKLLMSFNHEVYSIISLSLFVSLAAVLISSLISIPIGVLIGIKSFRFKGLVMGIIHTLMGLPPVIVGLIVYLSLSRSGPLGKYGLLFSPTAMIIAQIILVSPIIIGIVSGGLKNGGENIVKTVYTLGGSPLDTFVILIKEYKGTIITSLAASYGRAISEVGAVMMVGGNIKGHTRVMTTAIALETGKGNFSLAIAIGIVLIMVSMAINGIVRVLGGED